MRAKEAVVMSSNAPLTDEIKDIMKEIVHEAKLGYREYDTIEAITKRSKGILISLGYCVSSPTSLIRGGHAEDFNTISW